MQYQEHLEHNMLKYLNLFADSPIKLNASDIKAPTVSATGDTLRAGLGTVYLWAGIVCVIVIIIGGLRYTTSAGDSSGIQSAKNTILYGIVGLVIILTAAAITQFITGKF